MLALTGCSGLCAPPCQGARLGGSRQFDTLRLRLIKIAARVVELKTQIRLHLPSVCPYQSILRTVLGRLPRLLT